MISPNLIFGPPTPLVLPATPQRGGWWTPPKAQIFSNVNFPRTSDFWEEQKTAPCPLSPNPDPSGSQLCLLETSKLRVSPSPRLQRWAMSGSGDGGATTSGTPQRKSSSLGFPDHRKYSLHNGHQHFMTNEIQQVDERSRLQDDMGRKEEFGPITRA